MKHADSLCPSAAAPTALSMVLAALLAALAAPAGAQGAPLSNGATPSDTAIAADQRSFVAQEVAIEDLNRSGRHRLASYSLAKAQCWLDVSFHEYTQNDRSAFPQQALEQSALITRFLAGGGAVDDAANPALSTPRVNQAPKLRDDLWLDAERLKTHAGFRCAERLVACGEVELVHAGNEYAQLGWRHAKPYVQIAEDYLGEAKLAADACPPPPVPRPPEPPPPPPPAPEPLICPPVQACPAPPPPPPPAPPPARAPVTRSFDMTALFTFDGRTAGDLLPADRLKLRSTVMVLRNAYSRIDRIEVKGHTDRLGTPAYNVKLSQDRADAIKRALEQDQLGVEVVATGRGAAEPKPETLSCPPGNKPTKALIDCLQPSRRVEFVVTGVLREFETEAQPPARP